MPNDYYADAAAPPAAPKESAPEKEEPGDSQVGELPLAVFPEKPKVGDVCEFEVVQLSENSAVVKYATEKSEEPSEPAPEAPTPAGGGGDSMYE